MEKRNRCLFLWGLSFSPNVYAGNDRKKTGEVCQYSWRFGANRRPEPDPVLSAAARGGTISFLKSLAQEVGKYHIQCNTVALGLIGKDQPSIDSAIMTRIIKHYPLRRLGKIEDVTGMVLFLLSSRSDWMTGQSLPLTEDTVCLANCSIQFSGKKS